jgi:DNA replication protein DnaC
MNESTNSSQIAQLEPEVFEDARCDSHGAYRARVRMLTIVDEQHRVRSACPKCLAERSEREEAARIEAERAERNRTVAALRVVSGVPARFRDATLAGFVASTDAQRRIAQIAARYVERFDPKAGLGLVLSGGCGSGKTLLACAIANTLVERRRSARYLRVTDAVRSIKATYSKTSTLTESEAIAGLVTPDLLVLDEIGVQFGTEHEAVLLFEIIDRRYAECRSTILVSNLSAAELEKYLSERVMDRFRETGAVLAFDWPSFRGKNRAAC